MAPCPKAGDKIMIFKDHWLSLVLKKRKTLEIRHRALKPGKYWLGHKGVIRGVAVLGEAMQIPTTELWKSLRNRHLVDTPEAPYKTTWGLPILSVKKVEPVMYVHPRGAIGIVRFADASESPA